MNAAYIFFRIQLRNDTYTHMHEILMYKYNIIYHCCHVFIHIYIYKNINDKSCLYTTSYIRMHGKISWILLHKKFILINFVCVYLYTHLTLKKHKLMVDYMYSILCLVLALKQSNRLFKSNIITGMHKI